MEVSYEYDNYSSDVLSGKIVANKYIKQACQRYESWKMRDDIYFDEEDVNKKIRFIAKMRHPEGKFVRQPFILLPWQQFAIANIFGWKYKDTGYRVTKKVLMFCARKSGKTAFAAALSLACSLIDKEIGAEVDFLANNAKQAAIAMKKTQDYMETMDPRQKVFKKFRALIKVPATNSMLQVLSADSMGNDGYNSSCTIIDEFHAAKTWDTYNVMMSSMGARTQPLMIIITTAGFLLRPYPLYTMTEVAKEILAGVKEDDAMFSLIYTLDAEDDYRDESVWVKACPSIGATVEWDYMRRMVKDAENNSSLLSGVLTKNFNVWCESSNTWIAQDYLLKAMEPVDLSDYRDEIGYGGVDLSAVSDLTCFSLMLPPNEDRKVHPDKYIFKTWVYLPQEALETSTNAEYYRQWIDEGYLTMTSGNVVDYDYILKDQLQVNENNYMMGIGYDSWNATQWSINATNEGLQLFPYSQALGNFNRPTKLFEMLLKSGKVVIDYSPVVLWCFANVELKQDWNENVKPVKAAGDKNKKIDVTISMLEALGTYLLSNNCTPEVVAV